MENNQQSELALAPGEEGSRRAFTLKAVLFGLLGVILINSFAGFNDDRLRGTLFIGNHLPNGTYFIVICMVLVWNPLAHLLSTLFGFCRDGREWLRRRLMFGTGELVVSLSLMLLGSWTPTSGLYRYFHRILIMPWNFLPSHPSWQKFDLMGYLPQKLFPLGDKLAPGETVADLPGKGPEMNALYEKVYGGFFNGAATGNSLLDKNSLLDIFQYWEPSMLWYWGPLFVLFTIAIVAMSVIVHRQWAHHEQLSYPLAVITSSIIRRDRGRVLPDIFYSRMFQVTAVAVLAIQLLRLGAVWSQYIPSPWLSWWWPVNKLFPILNESGCAGGIYNGTLFFSIIGITYFLASEIGFTMGVSNILLTVVMAEYYLSSGRQLNSMDMANWRGGAYVGYALILLYTGRDYYWKVLKKALLLDKVNGQDERDTFWAAWLLLLAFGGMAALLVYAFEFDWVVALVFVLLLLLLFLVFTRIVCETGVPFLQPGWQPANMMLRGFGPTFFGAKALTGVNWISAVLTTDPRECLMPFVSNSLKVADDNKVRMRPLVVFGLVALMLALVVGFFARFTVSYSFGSNDDWHATQWVPASHFDDSALSISAMQATGVLDSANAASGLGKFLQIAPDGRNVTFILLGIAGVAAFSFLRFRFTNWPLHPLLFLVWGAYSTDRMFYAFLIGWGIKALIVYFGGGRIYQRLRPVFLGLIVGELGASAVGILVGFIYYCVTGQEPRSFSVFPV